MGDRNKVKNNTLCIPYYGQWESINLIDNIVDKKLHAGEDPLWERSGAISPDEYAFWSWNICGMACLKMILSSEFGDERRLIDLAKLARKYGCYIVKGTAVEGVFYKPFKEFVKKEFSLEVYVMRYLPLFLVRYFVSRGFYVIASVHPGIRDTGKNRSAAKGGHLVLITGFDRARKTISFHNPSGRYEISQVNHTIREREFNTYFARRGLIVTNHGK